MNLIRSYRAPFLGVALAFHAIHFNRLFRLFCGWCLWLGWVFLCWCSMLNACKCGRWICSARIMTRLIYIILLVQPKKFRHRHILRIQIVFSGKCFLKTNGVHIVFFNRGQASKMCVFGIRLEPALTYVFHQPAPPVSSQTKKTL